MKTEEEIRRYIEELEIIFKKWNRTVPRSELVRADETRTRHDIELLHWVLD